MDVIRLGFGTGYINKFITDVPWMLSSEKRAQQWTLSWFGQGCPGERVHATTWMRHGGPDSGRGVDSLLLADTRQ